MAKKSSKPKKVPKKKAPAKGSPNKYRAEAKKNKPNVKEAAKKVETKQEVLSGRNVMTLLDIPNRKKLPPQPNESDCRLYHIVNKHPDEYKEFLAFIRDGISVSSACAASGIGTNSEIMLYLRRGSQDINRNKSEIEDTYYSRFFMDFCRTAGLTVGEAEQQVKAADPKFWLRNSPLARMFNEDWRDDPDKRVSYVHSGSIDHFLGTSQDQGEEVNPDELILEGELIHSALEEMADAGLVTLTPDYELAKRIQAGDILSQEEMEGLEDALETGSDGVLQLDNQGMPLRLPKPESLQE